jgi:hypothetical protein
MKKQLKKEQKQICNEKGGDNEGKGDLGDFLCKSLQL